MVAMEDAETYDSYLVPAIFEPWSRELIKRAQVWKGDKVLDVCTGTGIVACRIAATGAAVTGIDIAADLLERARARASDEGVGVKWIEGSAESLPFRQPAFDLVTCQQGLQFVGDRALALREMRRVINPGGRAVIATWGPRAQQGAYAVLAELAVRHGATPSDTSVSLSEAAELTKLMTTAKFFAVNVEAVTRQVRVPDPDRFMRVTLASYGVTLDEAIAAEARAALEPFIEGELLVFPTVALIAVGRVKS
jgi:ubiquinone/menaquinone biosynthesis C-methylase UbiE